MRGGTGVVRRGRLPGGECFVGSVELQRGQESGSVRRVAQRRIWRS